VNPTCRCTVFRAGGWTAQPSHSLLRVMRELGLTMDSTVALDRYNDDLSKAIDDWVGVSIETTSGEPPPILNDCSVETAIVDRMPQVAILQII